MLSLARWSCHGSTTKPPRRSKTCTLVRRQPNTIKPFSVSDRKAVSPIQEDAWHGERGSTLLRTERHSCCLRFRCNWGTGCPCRLEHVPVVTCQPSARFANAEPPTLTNASPVLSRTQWTFRWQEPSNTLDHVSCAGRWLGFCNWLGGHNPIWHPAVT